MKLYYHSTSSASLRVLLFLKCRKVPEARIKLVSTGIKFDKRGIPVWTIPEKDEEALKLKTTDYSSLNPEGRVPLLLLNDGKKMTRLILRRLPLDSFLNGFRKRRFIY